MRRTCIQINFLYWAVAQTGAIRSESGAVVCWGRPNYGETVPPDSVDGTHGTASAIAAAILIAAVGPMTLSEVGTSFSDILTALPILAGCILILSANEARYGRYVLAGLLIGAAVGLKLTNVVYALGADPRAPRLAR